MMGTFGLTTVLGAVAAVSTITAACVTFRSRGQLKASMDVHLGDFGSDSVAVLRSLSGHVDIRRCVVLYVARPDGLTHDEVFELDARKLAESEGLLLPAPEYVFGGLGAGGVAERFSKLRVECWFRNKANHRQHFLVTKDFILDAPDWPTPE